MSTRKAILKNIDVSIEYVNELKLVRMRAKEL